VIGVAERGDGIVIVLKMSFDLRGSFGAVRINQPEDSPTAKLFAEFL
jgi:hypothetical protein